MTAALKFALRSAPLAGLMLASVFSTGCSTVSTARISMSEVAAMSPAPEASTAASAVEKSQAYVAAHPGAQVAMGTGDSMLPLYKDNTVVVIEPRAMGELKAGMTVVFKSETGLNVAHALVRQTADGWITQGLNNSGADVEEVTSQNYVGVVVKAYELDMNPMMALAHSLSNSRSGAYAMENAPAGYAAR